MSRRWFPPDGVLREGWYWVKLAGHEEPEIAFFGAHSWSTAGNDTPFDKGALQPISAPLRAPK